MKPLGTPNKKSHRCGGFLLYGVPKGIRTPVTAVKGRCPRPLDEGRAIRRYIKSLAVTGKRHTELPLPGIGHRLPGLLRGERCALLQ